MFLIIYCLTDHYEQKREKEKNNSKDKNTGKIWDKAEHAMNRKEKDENPKEKVVCNTCGNDTFRVYITIIIDDARLYCTKCGKGPEE